MKYIKGVYLCGTEDGIHVYDTQPKYLRKIDGSKIGSIEMCEILPNSNIIAFVSGGLQPKFAENTVQLYDETKQAVIFFYKVAERVLGIKLSKERIFIVQEREVCIYSIGGDARKIFSIYTSTNPKGLCAVNICTSIRRLMMIPGENGSVITYDLESMNAHAVEPYKEFKAHSSKIVAMSTNETGTKLATASYRGTLIRVFDPMTGERLIQFRRGTPYADIYCVSFSGDDNYLCCSSDTGTVHIFSLTNPTTSYLDIYTIISNYLTSKKENAQKQDASRSFAKFPIPVKTRNMCTFGTNHNIYAITHQGYLYEYKFEEGNGCVKEKIEHLHSLPLEKDIWFDADSNFKLSFNKRGLKF